MLGNIPDIFNISLISYAYSALHNFVNVCRYFYGTSVTSLFIYLGYSLVEQVLEGVVNVCVLY
jgi:hypothetical protein